MAMPALCPAGDQTTIMPGRTLRAGAAQVGSLSIATPRSEVVRRLTVLLEQAGAAGVELLVFPELTLTAFFPRYFIEDAAQLGDLFVKEDARGIAHSEGLEAFFARARELGIDLVLGYGEENTTQGVDGAAPPNRFNAMAYVSSSAGTVQKYRKVHVPGIVAPPAGAAVEPGKFLFEKRYFSTSTMGFPAFRAPGRGIREDGKDAAIVGMLLSNERKWSEPWRMYGLQGVEVMCVGFNTTSWAPDIWGREESKLSKDKAYQDELFHHKLMIQSQCYMNSTFCIAAARSGMDDNVHAYISGTIIVDSDGHILAENKTEGDELVWADLDLELCHLNRKTVLSFERHRMPEYYGAISTQRGIVEPPQL